MSTRVEKIEDLEIAAVHYPQRVPGTAMPNAMSIDVEDYFQVSAMESTVSRADWPKMEVRVERNVDRLLGLFDDCQVKATFFTLAWVAERFPEMIRRIVDGGHELASHGYSHVRVTDQDRDAFRDDVVKTKQILQDIGGVPVRGYRAASYSVNRNNLWALDVLAETGHEYSSSIAPVRHDLYGIPDAPRFPFRVKRTGLLEIPISTVRLLGRNQACGGGGWFRLFPYAFTRWSFRTINGADAAAGVFYLHPWEVDPEQPRVAGLPAKSRFRHYLNLTKTESRMRRLLGDFHWDRMDRVFLDPLAETR